MKYFYLFLIVLFVNLNTYAQKQKLEHDQKLFYKKTIEHLASDKLEGRLTGMPGELSSAKFIRDEMKSCGLKSADSTNYFQEFEFIYQRIPSSNNHLDIQYKTGSVALKFGVDYFLLSESGSNYNTGGLSAKVFDAGYGITPSKEKGLYADYKQYTKADSGKIFIIRLGKPKSKSEQLTLQNKIGLAIAMGASGIILINPDSVKNEPTGAMKLDGFISKIPIVFYKKDIGNIKDINEIGVISHIVQIKKTGHNVIGMYIRNPKKKFIVISAHHDHLGRSELGGSRTEGQKIHNGADDNASGVAMMLHLAKKLPSHRKYRKYNLLFVAFSGEEIGLLGSKHFLKNCPIDTQKILAMVNLNRVGRLNTQNHTTEINGIGTSPYWAKRVKQIKTDTSKLQITTSKIGKDASDHHSFYLARIPAVQISTGKPKEYHLPEDDADLINYDGMVKIEDYAVKLMCKIKRRRRRFRKTVTFE